MTSTEHLGQQLQEIADIIGVGPTLKLVEDFGGIELYVPRAPAHGQKLVQSIGIDAARQLAAEFGGLRLEVPLADIATRSRRRRAVIDAVLTEGMSKQRAARMFGLTTRHVRRLVNGRHAKDPNQGELI